MDDEAMLCELRVAKGTVVFRQGDEGRAMFLILSGRIRLTVGSEAHSTELATLGEGEFFGELALLGDLRRKATATALEESVLLCIEKDTFAMLVRDDLNIVFHMFNVQGQRLARTNVPLEALSERLARLEVGLRVLDRCVAGPQLPVQVSVQELVSDSGLGRAMIEQTAGDFADRGAGTLLAGAWVLEANEHVRALVRELQRVVRNG